MITGVSTSALSSLYRQQTGDYSKILGQIAAGKTFTKPSDDFAAYSKMNAAQSSISAYQRSNDSLVAAKETATIASSINNNMIEELNGLKDLIAGNTDGINDDAITTSIASIKTMYGDGIKAIMGSNGGTVTINAELGGGTTGGLSLAITDLSAVSGAIGGLTAANVDTALTAVTKMAAQSDAFTSSIDRQLTINQNIMSAKEDTVQNIGAIDDVQMLAKQTALEVRQMATISMATQANFSQQNIARLFA